VKLQFGIVNDISGDKKGFQKEVKDSEEAEKVFLEFLQALLGLEMGMVFRVGYIMLDGVRLGYIKHEDGTFDIVFPHHKK